MKQERVYPNLTRGDHIRVWRGTYYHHGIYCGDNVVIHYTGEVASKTKAIIKEDRLETFLAGGKVEVATYHQSLPSDTVIQNARQRIGEQRYHLVFNNCEHFASWCKTGEHKSNQVNLVFHTLMTTVINPLPLVAVQLGKEIVYHVINQDNSMIEEIRRNFPQNIFLLFSRFQKAYEQKDIQQIDDTISAEFYSDVFGGTKERFMELMKHNLSKFIYGVYPSLAIDVFGVSSNTEHHFSVIVEITSRLKVVGISIFRLDFGKLIFEAKAEGSHKYWRITKLVRFQD